MKYTVYLISILLVAQIVHGSKLSAGIVSPDQIAANQALIDTDIQNNRISLENTAIALPTIAYGYKAHEGQFPTIASLRRKADPRLKEDPSLTYHKCGSTLIHNNLIITAAHCLDFDKTGQLEAPIAVYLGGLNASNAASFKEHFTIKSWKIHDNYIDRQAKKRGFDIAILELNGMSNIKPAQLNTQNPPTLNSSIVAAGWGRVESDKGGEPSDDLLFLPLHVNTGEGFCAEFSHLPGVICSLSPEIAPGKFASLCPTDSGGPQYSKSSPNTLVSLTSFGDSGLVICGKKQYNGFTSIAYHLKGFIYPTMKLLGKPAFHPPPDHSPKPPSPLPSPSPKQPSSSPLPAPSSPSPSPLPLSPLPLPSPSLPSPSPSPLAVPSPSPTALSPGK